MLTPLKIVFVFAIALLFTTTGLYAAPPNAGSLLREQQQGPRSPGELQQPDEIETKPAQESGVRILVKSFRFTGYQGVCTQEELQKIVADEVDKAHSFAGLQGVVNKVVKYLKNQGWLLIQAYLPQQDVSSGIVTIAIVQGKSDGNLYIEGDQSLRMSTDRLKHMGQQTIKKGEPFNTQKVERTILLINDLPGITAKGTLSAGTTPGTAALTIKASEDPLVTGAVLTDNFGNRYTGALRGSGLLQVNDPLKIGDQASFNLTESDGMGTAWFNYSLPFGTSGLRMHVAYTYLWYKLGEEYKTLNADGTAQSFHTGLAYPLIRSRKNNVYTSLDYEYKDLNDAVYDTDYSSKTIHKGILTVQGDHYDTVLGTAGLTSWYASATYGHMNEEIADLSITNTQGDFTYFQVSLSRLQQITQRLIFEFGWLAQFSRGNLDSSEQFCLGGPYGVRAYPVNEGLGDQGHLFNVGLNYSLPVPENYGELKAGPFYEAGHITLHKDPWTNSITSTTGDNHYWLQGAGFKIEYSHNDRFSLYACWAHTIGSNNNRSSDGKDCDGKDNNNRVWLQAIFRF